MQRENYSSGTSWEALAGYSRAVKVGQFIYVSGTTATDAAGELVGENDMQAQTTQTIKNIETALAVFGGTLADVVRTRMFVTDISLWEETVKVHGEFFGDIRPASTLVEVTKLIDERMLIEIEVDAILLEK